MTQRTVEERLKALEDMMHEVLNALVLLTKPPAEPSLEDRHQAFVERIRAGR